MKNLNVPVYDSSMFVWTHSVGRSTASQLSSHDVLGFFVEDATGRKKAYVLQAVKSSPMSMAWDIYRSDDDEEIRVARAQ